MSEARARDRPLVQRWSEPIVVVGGAGAVEGAVAVPANVAELFVGEPFDDHDLPATGRHAAGPRALVAAIGKVLQNSLGERAPAGADRAIVVGTDAAALSEVIFFLDEIDSVGAALVNPGLFPFTVMNAAAGLAAIRHSCLGPNVTLNNGVASALEAVACAADLLATGQAEVVFAGGFEGLSPKASAGLRREGPTGAIAAVLALTTRATAIARGLPLMARLLGFAAGGEGSDVGEAAVAAASLGLADCDAVSIPGTVATTAEESLRSLLAPLSPATGARRLSLVAAGAGGAAALVFACGTASEDEARA